VKKSGRRRRDGQKYALDAPAAGADDVGGVGGAGAVQAGAADLSSRPVGGVLVAAPGDVP
jgi:hypothetical protein